MQRYPEVEFSRLPARTETVPAYSKLPARKETVPADYGAEGDDPRSPRAEVVCPHTRRLE